METLRIKGGKRLCGETMVQGAKNSALPCLAATLLGRNCIIHNCPDLKDTRVALEILESLGAKTHFKDNTAIINVGNEFNFVISEKLMKKMRSSVVFLGAILARCKKAEISYPGGCSIGARPIDLHLKAFREMGVEIEFDGDKIICSMDRIKDAKIRLNFPSVGATENIMLLSVFSDAEVEIINGAKEPEIMDLQSFLNSMGGDIRSRNGRIFIKGQQAPSDTEYKIMPDRIVALTYLCGICACGGQGRLNGVRPEHLTVPIEMLESAGSIFKTGDSFIEIKAPKRMDSLGIVETAPYPDFPTDAQAIFMAVASRCRGESCFIENIFENRFHHIKELGKLGANIESKENIAYVTGRRRLKGNRLFAEDLRGGASLVIGALASKGESIIENIGYIDRGYEKIERNFSDLGAEIVRE